MIFEMIVGVVVFILAIIIFSTVLHNIKVTPADEQETTIVKEESEETSVSDLDKIVTRNKTKLFSELNRNILNQISSGNYTFNFYGDSVKLFPNAPLTKVLKEFIKDFEQKNKQYTIKITIENYNSPSYRYLLIVIGM